LAHPACCGLTFVKGGEDTFRVAAKIVADVCGDSKGLCGINQIFSQFFYHYSFYNSSTIFPRRLPDEGPKNLSTNILNFFHNYSLLAVYPSEETKILQRTCGRIVEEFREGFSLLRLTRILRVKAGKCAWGIIVD
jgi:hypothetical protein